MASSRVVAVRLPDDLIVRIEAHGRQLQDLTGLEPSRSELVKLLVERGLGLVEAAVEPEKSRTRRKGG